MEILLFVVVVAVVGVAAMRFGHDSREAVSNLLRNAFAKTLTDPEFVTEAKRGNLDINPLSGEEVKQLVDGLFKLDPVMLSKLKTTLAAK